MHYNSKNQYSKGFKRKTIKYMELKSGSKMERNGIIIFLKYAFL